MQFCGSIYSSPETIAAALGAILFAKKTDEPSQVPTPSTLDDEAQINNLMGGLGNKGSRGEDKPEAQSLHVNAQEKSKCRQSSIPVNDPEFKPMLLC